MDKAYLSLFSQKMFGKYYKMDSLTLIKPCDFSFENSFFLMNEDRQALWSENGNKLRSIQANYTSINKNDIIL